MANHQETILEQAIIALENLQGLNENDLKVIHQLDTTENLEKCTRQLVRLLNQLERYRSNDLVGTTTTIGMINGIRKNSWHQISEYNINGHWMKASEFKKAVENKPFIECMGTAK